MRQELLGRRPQRPEPAAAKEERQPKAATAEPDGDVAAVDEAQLEQPEPPAPADVEGTRVEALHDPASDAEIDHHADAHADPHVAHPERARRQERERRVVSRRGPPRRCRDDMESRLRAGREPEPPRAKAEPGRGAAGGPHPGLAPQRTGESCSGDVDEQRPAPRVAHDDRRRRRSPQGQAQRTGTEADAPAGRGTRDGCRGRTENERHERASHLPITVNVSVAV